MSDKFSTSPEKASYGIGLQIGDHLLSQPFDGMNTEAVLAGISDRLEGLQPQLPEAEIRAALDELNRRMQQQQEQVAKAQAGEGERFLAENAKREGVAVTESGLQYEVMVEGSGDKPGPESKVRVHYHGSLVNGSVFDSSVQRGEPAEFPVNGVIAGWTEALQMMPVGSKWKLTVPHNLAYGERGAGGVIGPYATLVFEVELLDIV